MKQVVDISLVSLYFSGLLLTFTNVIYKYQDNIYVMKKFANDYRQRLFGKKRTCAKYKLQKSKNLHQNNPFSLKRK